MDNRRALWQFVLIAFGWSWLLWMPYAAMQQGVTLPSSIAVFFDSANSLGAWGPLVAALVAMYRDRGRDGVVALLKRGIRFRFLGVDGARWQKSVRGPRTRGGCGGVRGPRSLRVTLGFLPEVSRDRHRSFVLGSGTSQISQSRRPKQRRRRR